MRKEAELKPAPWCTDIPRIVRTRRGDSKFSHPEQLSFLLDFSELHSRYPIDRVFLSVKALAFQLNGRVTLSNHQNLIQTPKPTSNNSRRFGSPSQSPTRAVKMSVLAATVLRAAARRTAIVSTLSVSSHHHFVTKSASCQTPDRSNIDQTTPSRPLSSSTRTQNNVTAVPIADAVRNVAQRAQEGVMIRAGEEGFKAGVLATLLGGSALTAGYLLFTPGNGKTVNANELL